MVVVILSLTSPLTRPASLPWSSPHFRNSPFKFGPGKRTVDAAQWLEIYYISYLGVNV